MISRHALLALTSLLALAGTAQAAGPQAAVAPQPALAGAALADRAEDGSLNPLDARVVALGAGSAVVYYTYDPAGSEVIRVVTTLGTDPAGAGPSARFVSYLAPGQTAEVSVATLADALPAAVELAYDGDRLTVRPVRERPQS